MNTEERIITGLREGLDGLGGATTLLTAHRPSTVALADRVLLMVDGSVVAEGTHAELMDSSEQYRQLMTIEEGYGPLSSGGATRADEPAGARETRERSMALLRQMLRPHRGALVLSIISVLLRPGQPRLCRF